MTGPSERSVPAPSSSGGRLAVAVAAVVQLAEELIDEVAPVGEDEDAAGARGLDEAHRGDGLAGAGGVLEPEALVGVGVVGRALLDVLVDVGLGVVLPDVLGLVVLVVLVVGLRLVVLVVVVVVLLGGGLDLRLVVVVLVVVLVGVELGLVVVLVGLVRRSEAAGASGSGSSSTASTGSAAGGARPWPFWTAASSAVRVPESASTWWGFSSAPSARRGSSSLSTRSSPSSSA